MNFFDVINEVGIFGTALLMMAVGIIWYSKQLFGGIVDTVYQRAEERVLSQSHIAWMFVCTFASYIVVLSLVAYAVELAPHLALSLLQVCIGATSFAGAILGLVTVCEGKPLKYFLVQLGFCAVLIIGGGVVVHYWPW